MNTPVPLNSLTRHIAPFTGRLQEAAGRVIESGYFVLGPHVEAFEREFALYCDAAHCVGVANGTDALEIALKAVGVRNGDHVALCANAAMYSTTASLACGASPLFVDTLEGDGTMSPTDLRGKLSSAATMPKAVVVTHLYGQLARVREIVEICSEYGIKVVEDCAQAHGARDAASKAGTFGDVASFSFYPTKNLGALGDGGAVVTNDASVAGLARRLRQYGWIAKYDNGEQGGRNSRLDEIQAAMLSVLLPELDKWNERRRLVAQRYRDGISNDRIVLPCVNGGDYVAHLFVVRTEDRDKLRNHLAAQGVQSEIHYPKPDHKQACLAGRYENVYLPNTEHDARTVLTLPCFPEMTDDEVARVINACNSY